MFRETSTVEMTTPPDRKASGDLGTLWPFLRQMMAPYAWPMVGAVVILMVAAASLLGLGQGVKILIDEGMAGDPRRLRQAMTLFSICVALIAGASFGRLYVVSWISERIMGDFRKRLFAHLVHLDVPFFETVTTGEMISRLTTDVMLVQVVVGTSLPIAIRNLMIIWGGLGMLLYTCPTLTLSLVVVIPLVLVPMLIFGKKVRHLSKHHQQAVGTLSHLIEETFTDMRAVHLFGRQRPLIRRFGNQVDQVIATAMQRVKARAWLTTLVIGVVFSAVVFFTWLGGYSIQQGALTAGALSSFVFYATAVAGSLGSLSEIYADLQRAAGATQRFLELFTHVPTITSPINPTPLPQPFKGEIVFENVGFAYPGRPDAPIFEDLNLVIVPGEKVAFVGLSGEGKSSLFYLLMRLYTPLSGKILLDGVPLDQLALEDFRQVVGVVPQEPLLTQGTVFENIQYDFPDVTSEQAKEAAKKADILGFIEDLPKGFDTILSPRGGGLSVGQRQRLALARALVRNPKILLLDEATSALDAQREFQVQDTLTHIKGCTVLVIAHRLSTIQHMDRIVVLEGGKIVASGTHRQLLKNTPTYRHWVELQVLETGDAQEN